jgi:hypothetical protein
MQRPTAQMADVRPPHYPVSGWVEAGLYVVAIAILSLTYVVGFRLGAHPIAFVLYAMLTSALALLLVTGLGPNARAIALTPQSWTVGAGTILMEMFYFLLLAHIAPAHGSLIVRLSIPLSMLAAFVIFRRRPANLAIAGALIVCGGILPLVYLVTPQYRMEVLLWGLLSAAAFNLRGFSAEFHPWNRAAKTIRDKLQVTGIIVLVTSLAGIGLALMGALAVALGLVAPMPLVPTFAEMVHLPTVLLGVLVGSVILTAMAYLGFSAVVKITTENFAATSAFTPVATLLVQLVASAIGLIPVYALDMALVPAMAVVIAGVFLILHAARRR